MSFLKSVPSSATGRLAGVRLLGRHLGPGAGFEPAPSRLAAENSATELPRSELAAMFSGSSITWNDSPLCWHQCVDNCTPGGLAGTPGCWVLSGLSTDCTADEHAAVRYISVP